MQTVLVYMEQFRCNSLLKYAAENHENNH